MEKYPGGGRHKPLLAAHERPPSGKAAVDVAALFSAQPYPLLVVPANAVAERDGATLRLKEGGGVFYAPGPLESVAVHWPRLVAGAQSGALYHLEVQG